MAIETSATQQSRRPRHNPENNNAIDNGRENLHSIIVIIEITTSTNNMCFIQYYLLLVKQMTIS
jgi:hypothetical protein